MFSQTFTMYWLSNKMAYTCYVLLNNVLLNTYDWLFMLFQTMYCLTHNMTLTCYVLSNKVLLNTWDGSYLLCSFEQSGIVHEKAMKKGKAGKKITHLRMSFSQLTMPPSSLASLLLGGEVLMGGQQGRQGQICMVSSSSSSSCQHVVV